MAISEGEYILMSQQTTKMVRDNRAAGVAKNWIVSGGVHRRLILDAAEETFFRDLYNMPPGPLDVVSWTILQRVPEVT